MGHRGFQRIVSLAVVSFMLCGCTSRVERAPSQEAAPPDFGVSDWELQNAGESPSFDPVDYSLTLTRWEHLAVTRPEDGEVRTTADEYYITGVSDPDRELTVNGEPVEHRGRFGSFGVFVELEDGDNTFVFSQGGDASVTAVITKAEAEVATTRTMVRMRPEIDAATRGGNEYTLSCTAPSGAVVTAAVGGQTVSLEQVAATAVEGVPAAFSATFVPHDVDGTVELGPVTYTMEYDGETKELESLGILYVVGKNDSLLVRGRDTCSTVFTEADTESEFYTTILQDGVDEVAEIGSAMYRLATGGWVLKEAVEPLTGATESGGTVTGVSHSLDGNREVIRLEGTSTPPYKAQWEDGVLTVTLHRTTGVEFVPLADGPSVLKEIDVLEQDGSTSLTFHTTEPLLGYLVEYEGSVTNIVLKPRPTLAEGDRPLTGLTIALDPGHGGSDAGADGVPLAQGPREKDITLATAFAVRDHLQSLGADVVLLRDADERVELDDRLAMIRQRRFDLSVSVHCNSISYSKDGTGPSGTETFYFDDQSEELAQAIQAAVIRHTGRRNREAKQGYYKITLNSYAPSVMVEMGFLTNPVEYDELISGDGMQAVALAIGDGIVAALSPPSDSPASGESDGDE